MSDTVQLSSSAIRRQMLAEFWFYFRQNRGAVAGLVVFILLVLTGAPVVSSIISSVSSVIM